MKRDERQQIRAIVGEVAEWSGQARSILERRAAIDAAANDAVETLRRAVVDVGRDGTAEWRVLPLRSKDSRILGRIARRAQLPSITPAEKRTLKHLSTDIAAAIRDVRSVVGARRFVSGSKKKDSGYTAARYLSDYRAWGMESGLSEFLSRITDSGSADPGDVPVADALSEWVGFAPRVSDLGESPELVAVAVFAGLPLALATIDRAIADQARLRDDAISAGNAVRSRQTRALLAEMSVERLKDATRDRLRTGPLTNAGITTVQQVLDGGGRLEQLPGVGTTTAVRLRGAARALWQTTYDEMPARIDIKDRTAEATELLRRLAHWDAARKLQGSPDDLARAEELRPLDRVLGRNVSHVAVFGTEGRSAAELRESADAVIRSVSQVSGDAGSAPRGDPWADFLARPADYFAMLSELGFITEDEQKTHGDLPEEIVEAVRSLELDTEHLSVSLRGYQSFGARFALVQRKVIVGDEMGLGKTVEALAVLAHLWSKGEHHSLVVCPAAVVTNWVREISAKSALRAHRVHGPERDTAARDWVRMGGVAVTTFETLAWFEDNLTAPEIGCVVVDEAHYIKNPEAKRTRRTTRVVNSCPRAVLMTGTPLENRAEEFRNLVGYLRRDLLVDAGDLSPRRFRRQVAPAYLRRNQEDVLTELPDLVEVEEWLPLSQADAAAYRKAVEAGNFMAMRRAAMSHDGSEKMRRLTEIIREAEDNNRRVVVFSYFRGVLEQAAHVLPGRVFGPLTGSVPAAERQAMVDRFSAAGSGAVLVAQITAGGVGLNIQSASVVAVCEPQLKPTTEWQAVARARRMGQLESVQVHRLLSEEGVDRRITEILARKREVFGEFARISDAAESAPEAFDISEGDLAREVVAAERERLFSQSQRNGPPPRPSASHAFPDPGDEH